MSRREALAWNGFATDHLPLIEGLDAVDPTSAAFIDLQALNKHVEHFESHVTGYVDYLSENALL